MGRDSAANERLCVDPSVDLFNYVERFFGSRRNA